MAKLKTRDLVLCGLFAALTGITSQITIPIGPVPVNMAHVAIFVGAGLLKPRLIACSQIIFILMGVMGLPVFSGFRGGMGHLLGPTGGFIIGYVICGWATAHLLKKIGLSWFGLIFSMIIGALISYGLGTFWFMEVTGADLATALLLCVVPFLFGDFLKILLSGFLIRRIRKVM